MLKKIFTMLSIFVVTIICVLSFILPSNPHKIIPSITAMGFDKPMWLCYFVTGSFLYLLILWSSYKVIKKK